LRGTSLHALCDISLASYNIHHVVCWHLCGITVSLP